MVVNIQYKILEFLPTCGLVVDDTGENVTIAVIITSEHPSHDLRHPTFFVCLACHTLEVNKDHRVWMPT